MKITLTHCKHAPTWSSLQRLLQEVTSEPFGVLTHIERRDRGCDYHAPGVYDLKFRLPTLSCLSITLEVFTGQGRPKHCWEVSVPNALTPGTYDGLGCYETEAEAVAAAREYWGADENGMISIVNALEADEEDGDGSI